MPSPELLSKIAAIFNITLDSLLCGSKTDMIDVSGVRPDQRAIVEELIKYFKAFNELSNLEHHPLTNILAKYDFDNNNGKK